MSAVTLSQVAREAGVSLATASRVLNGSDRRPAEHIAERVRDAAESLGYVANAQAQALARSTTGLVGLVVHDIADPYFSSIAKGVQRRARADRHQLLLAATDGTDQLDAVAAFASHRTDAIIMAGSRRREIDPRLLAELTRYQKNGGRVVTIGQAWLEGAGAVTIDNRSAGDDLTDMLIGTGRTRFAFLGGPDELASAAERRAGFRAALERAGLEPEAEVTEDFNSQGGYEAARALVDRLGADAVRGLTVVVGNDVMALGAIAGFRHAGLVVPDDLRVAGFDDIPNLRDFSPGLTTVRFPLEQIGETAADIALSHDQVRIEHVVGEIVRRESA
ncbi:LacI family DNA-binding transcriptional regulator [Kocuria rosea]|jgi:LacI family transcriptional regulator|uniref:LacI family DNA-binding transcriptional regulator n=1 Tax=Kocuria rosea TaxID=1275 RepID=UPI000F706004|nr:LacI family DNA-binding transcriptional regulator [Kocuria rosea]MCM3486123.1 LacI family transcriptional regulator [Kocuria rosea]MEB2526552.1 LacI family DNA-binding transcriptional regulator [Kocuria rosea]MEB2619004.1 LacI family DNA-binding transcriptional regulator [Kocuria rosea]THE18915.1 LacI family transcriptional regulator [Kocuria rosea]VEH41817.1 Ribose operon repressor [Kocuria rosea]